MALVINKFNQCTTRLFEDFIVPFDRKINLKAEKVRKATVSFFKNNPELAKPFCELAKKTFAAMLIANTFFPDYVPWSMIIGCLIGTTSGMITVKAIEFDKSRNEQNSF